MELQLIRSATIKIKYAGKTILVDPMFSQNTSAPLQE
jgi:L-ascorbate metabolism protein UlaG (beta-lactamase superfamily)